MFEKCRANRLFRSFLKRPDIEKAYAMVPPTDSWYDTITKVHDSLAQIRQLPHETWQMESFDGTNLQAIYYPGDSDRIVICCHGYTSHAEREWAYPGLFYHSLGFHVLIPYQRAHGPSGGKWISFGAWEHKDVMLWVEWICQKFPQGQILVHGLSMGGGIVLALADKPMENVKALIADAPNVSIEDFLYGITKYKCKDRAERVYPHLVARFRKEFGVDVPSFNHVTNLAGGCYPLLLAAGSKEQMEEVFGKLKQANPMQTQIVILPGCDHGNGMYKQTEMFQTAIKEFLDNTMTR